jgi:acetyl/propionyl-CoA carboxylase alpha subunit
MLAKLVVWAPDREGAIERMRRCLEELNIGGIKTSATAAMRVMHDEGFRSGDFHTQSLEAMDMAEPESEIDRAVAAAVAVHRWHAARRHALGTRAGERLPWLQRGRISVTSHPHRVSETAGFAREETGV